MAEYDSSDPGDYVQIQPHAQIANKAPADYSARLAAAKKTLGRKWCLAYPINGRIPVESKPQIRLVRKTT
jgi:hypothetical protein